MGAGMPRRPGRGGRGPRSDPSGARAGRGAIDPSAVRARGAAAERLARRVGAMLERLLGEAQPPAGGGGGLAPAQCGWERVLLGAPGSGGRP